MPFLPPPQSDFEKILAYGASDAGKTHMWMSIADMYVKTKTDGRFWVIDNDNTTRRLMGPRGQFAHIAEIVDVFVPSAPHAFEESEEYVAKVMDRADPDTDWFVMDMLSNVWDSMSAWWIHNVFEDTGVSYWARARKEAMEREDEGKRDERIGGQKGVDWEYIKKAYLGWEKTFTLHPPCNVFAVAIEKSYTDFNDRKGERQEFYEATGGFGAGGEKTVQHRFHTVVRATRSLERTGRGTAVKERSLTMVKDRDREDRWAEIGGEGMSIVMSNSTTSFARDYLMKVAEWGVRK